MIPNLSASQLQKLSQVGIKTLYELITFLPFGLEVMVPYGSSDNLFGQNIAKDSKVKELEIGYFLEAELVSIEQRQSSRSFSVLRVHNQEYGDLNLYFFGTSAYVMRDLVVGATYQFLLKKKGDFWSASKFVVASNEVIETHFVLGKASTKVYYLPKYHKTGILQSAFFRQVFSQLRSSNFLINLDGMFPQNDVLPIVIDLAHVHRPQSPQQFMATVELWNTFLAFLRLSLVKYLESQSEQILVDSTEVDLEFLKLLVGSLPYDLSDSQKSTTWQILEMV
jgi:RecG-like helicase